MKKSLLIAGMFLALLSTANLNAQKSVIKLNLLSPIFRTANLQFEHAISPKGSLQLGVYYTGIKISSTGFSGFGITPEYRFYPGADGAPKGFFLAPFFRYQSFSLKVASASAGVDSEATLTSLRPGLCIGYQLIFGDRVSCEFFIGPSYSSTDLKVKTGSESDFSLGSFDGFGIRSGLTLGFAF